MPGPGQLLPVLYNLLYMNRIHIQPIAWHTFFLYSLSSLKFVGWSRDKGARRTTRADHDVVRELLHIWIKSYTIRPPSRGSEPLPSLTTKTPLRSLLSCVARRSRIPRSSHRSQSLASRSDARTTDSRTSTSPRLRHLLLHLANNRKRRGPRISARSFFP